MAITPTKVFPYGALALLLSACAALQTAGGQVSANPSGQGTGTSATPSAEKGGPGFTSTSPVGEAGSAVLKGAATGPAGLVSGNTSALLGNAGAGLVGNSGAGLIGNSGAGLIGNAGAGYRIQAFAQDPIANALVYLTDPQERFFSRSDGTIVSTTTTASGDFIFPNTITASADTIVNVILAGNRREVGFTLPVAGVNVVEISVSSTFVTEFIRQHAKRDGKAMGAYPGGMASLPRLTELTRAALDAGQLTFDGTATGSLNIGNIEGSLNRLYGIAVGKNLNGLGEAWASFFGYRVRALETILGTGENGLADGGPATTVPINVPQELALAADGTLYLAEEKNNLVRVVKPDGTAAIVAGSSKGTAGSSGDGGKATSAQFSNPRAVALGPDGNLYVADASAIRVVALTATPSPWAGGTWQVGNIYRVVGSGLNPASVDGPVASASVVSPRGMLIDGTGNLYFTEGKTTQAGVAAWNHVRVITPSSAAEQTLFGVTCASGSVTKLAGADNSAGFAGDDGPARSAQFSVLNNVALDLSGNLLVTDSFNHRLRCIAAADGTFYGQTMKRGHVYSIAGNGTAGSGGDGGPALAGQLNLPNDVKVDAKGRIYVSGKGSGAIRIIDTAGKFATLGGMGTGALDNDALLVKLSEPLFMALEPNGNLLISESRGARVRRLYLQGTL